MTKTLSALAAVVLSLVLIGGCGDDGSPGDSPSGTQTEDDGGGY